VEFKQFGVSLAVVPTVLSPDRLNLRVRPEVSQLSSNGAVSVPIQGGTVTIPALTVRRAETTVELGSGQSFAIAGLLQKTTVDQTNALPGIGEVPVIGALFKSNNFQRGRVGAGHYCYAVSGAAGA
jgi:pilus assembly protein CpaC